MPNQQNKKPQWVAAATVMWVSFLFASVATMLFFATFDPALLSQVATFPIQLDRMAGYTVGFLLFWLLLILNASVVIWLMKTPKPRGEVTQSD